MNFSNLASTPFGRGRGSWPTSSTLPGTPHFSAFQDLGAPIKLPKFYDDDGLLWFKVAKAIFSYRGLSDDKRKCELLSALDHRHLSILEFPLAHLGKQPYDDLKSALLRHYAPTEEEKLHQLLYQTTLSFEQKPSELLGKMRGLMGPNVVLPPRVLRKLFLDQMPCETRKMLLMHDSEDLDGLAKMADQIHENDSRVSRTAASSAGYFSQVTKTPTTSLSLDWVSDKLNDLSVCVERLNATVSNLCRSHPASHNNFSPQHFSTPKRDGEFFRGPRNFRNSQNNFQGPAAEVESRTQGSRPRTQKKSEAKAKDSLSKDRHSRGQGQECSRPRPRTKGTSASALQKKKKVFTKIFQAIFTKKRFPKNFSTAPRYFNNSKNSAVLKPRTGQFSRT